MTRRLFAAFLLLLAPALVGAQKPSSAELFTRLRGVTAKTSLMEVARPWHLVVEVTIAAANGKPEQKGTIERWHTSDADHTIWTFGESRQESIDHEGKSWVGSAGGPIPDLADYILHTVEFPGPSEGSLANTVPELRKQKFGTAELQCIMLNRPLKYTDYATPLGLFPAYCLSDDDHLNLMINMGGQNRFIQSLGKFLDHEIATHIVIANSGTVGADGKVTTLSTFVPTATTFEPSAGMTEKPRGRDIAKIPGGVLAGHRIGGNPPTYPSTAKQNHVGGTVVLHAVIGRDGHIYSLEPVSAPSMDLAISALAAVRTWTYTPYLLNGAPSSVDTTITVNYNLNGG